MKYFLLLVVAFLANCTFTYRTNSLPKPDKEITLANKIHIKVIAPADTIDSGLREDLKDKLSSNPKIESVEVFTASQDKFHFGNHTNTLVIRLQKEIKEAYSTAFWLLTLGVLPAISTKEFPTTMQFYDEKGESEYLTGIQTVGETELNTWFAIPLLPVNLFLPKANQKSVTLSSLYFFLDKTTNAKLVKSAGSAEKLTLTPETQKTIEEWNKEFAWREQLTQEQMIKIYKATPTELETYLKEEKSSDYASFYALQMLAGMKMKDGDFKGASSEWKKYQSNFPNKKSEITEIIRMLEEKEISQIRNLGAEINSSSDEYIVNPEVSGRKLYFTANSRAGGSGGEDVWESNFNEEEGKWSKATPVYSLNDSGNQAPIAISPDGTELSLFGSYSGSFGRGDIFKSKLTATGWGNPVNPGRPINSEYFDSDICFSSDGNAILFVSDRPASYFPFRIKDKYYAGSFWGNTDIYVSLKNEDGSFGAPRNLGAIINTPGGERTPFLHPDGKTLYFSSDAHNGFGDLDIFKTVRLDDTWQNWSKPVNLGKSLNGAQTDWGFKMTAASANGYFSADLKDSNGRGDLYEIVPLPDRAKPAGEVVAIYGKILDQNGNPAEATVVWQDLRTGKTIGQLRSKATTGEFYITLPVGGIYAYFATIKGYLNQSQKIDLSKEKKFREVNFEMKLVSIDSAVKEGTEITLNNITFEAGKDVLRPESFAELDRLIQVMTDSPKIKVEVQGHTSSERGVKEETNLDLSNRRAKSVYNYLISKGIAKDRLSSKGYGSSKPTADNDKEENRIKNRRVTFTVSKE